MKRVAMVAVVAMGLSTGAWAADVDSVFTALNSASKLMDAGAEMLKGGAVIGKVDSVMSLGKVTQVQTGGRDSVQEVNVGSVIGGKVIGVFQSQVSTKDVTQQQSGTNNRQALNLAVVR